MNSVVGRLKLLQTAMELNKKKYLEQYLKQKLKNINLVILGWSNYE